MCEILVGMSWLSYFEIKKQLRSKMTNFDFNRMGYLRNEWELCYFILTGILTVYKLMGSWLKKG